MLQKISYRANSLQTYPVKQNVNINFGNKQLFSQEQLANELSCRFSIFVENYHSIEQNTTLRTQLRENLLKVLQNPELPSDIIVKSLTKVIEELEELE